MFHPTSSGITAVLLFLGTAIAAPAACPTLSSSAAAPSVAKGYSATLVANGLSSPRGIAFDTAGNLLIIQSGHGVEALTFANNSGCISLTSKKAVVNATTVSVTSHLVQQERGSKKTISVIAHAEEPENFYSCCITVESWHSL